MIVKNGLLGVETHGHFKSGAHHATSKFRGRIGRTVQRKRASLVPHCDKFKTEIK